MDSPEYKTLNQCYPKLVSCIGQSPDDVDVQLRPHELLAPGDVSFLNNPEHNKTQKAKKIADAILDQVKINPQHFHLFVQALEAAGPWTRTIVTELKHPFITSTQVNVCYRAQEHSGDSKGQAQPFSPSSNSDSQVVKRQAVEARLSSSEVGGEMIDQSAYHMRTEFSGLLHSLIGLIKKNGKTVNNLTTFLQQIKVPSATGNSYLLFTAEYICKIETVCCDVDDAFTVLKGYYSWFNFHLIEYIINEFCDEDEEVKVKLTDYKAHMKQLCEARLCDFPGSRYGFGTGEHRSGTKPCVFNVDKHWTIIKLSDLEVVKGTICDVLRLNRLAVSLQVVGSSSNGCVEVTFDIPQHLGDAVFPLSKGQVETLTKHGIKYCERPLTHSGK